MSVNAVLANAATPLRAFCAGRNAAGVACADRSGRQWLTTN
jgi:hypothetical protein